MSFMQCGDTVFFYTRSVAPATDTASALAGRREPEPMTLVFVNGLGTDHRIWDDVVAALPSRWSMLRYDQRGHGLSELGHCPYTLAQLSHDLGEVLDGNVAGPVVLCGLSLGGLVAQQFAAAHPERVRALCLSGTALRIGTRETWQARAEQVLAAGLVRIAPSVMDRWFSEPFRSRNPAAVRGHRAMLERTPADAYVRAAQALGEADVSPGAQSIRMPTLVLAGELDLAATPAQGRALADAIPHARFELLSGAGHLMCVERPLAFARALTEFLGDNGIG
jgi:3-oxoadipate enol-lactonase